MVREQHMDIEDKAAPGRLRYVQGSRMAIVSEDKGVGTGFWHGRIYQVHCARSAERSLPTKAGPLLLEGVLEVGYARLAEIRKGVGKASVQHPRLSVKYSRRSGADVWEGGTRGARAANNDGGSRAEAATTGAHGGGALVGTQHGGGGDGKTAEAAGAGGESVAGGAEWARAVLGGAGRAGGRVGGAAGAFDAGGTEADAGGTGGEQQ